MAKQMDKPEVDTGKNISADADTLDVDTLNQILGTDADGPQDQDVVLIMSDESKGVLQGAVTSYLAVHLAPLVDAAVAARMAFIQPDPPAPVAMVEDDGGAAARKEAERQRVKAEKLAEKARQDRVAAEKAAQDKFATDMEKLATDPMSGDLTGEMASDVLLTIDNGATYCLDWHKGVPVSDLKIAEGGYLLDHRLVIGAGVDAPFRAVGVSIHNSDGILLRCDIPGGVTIGGGHVAELAAGSLFFRS